MRYVTIRNGLVGDKAKWIAAVRANCPGLGTADIAESTGVSERYVRQIQQQVTMSKA